MISWVRLLQNNSTQAYETSCIQTAKEHFYTELGGLLDPDFPGILPGGLLGILFYDADISGSILGTFNMVLGDLLDSDSSGTSPGGLLGTLLQRPRSRNPRNIARRPPRNSATQTLGPPRNSATQTLVAFYGQFYTGLGGLLGTVLHRPRWPSTDSSTQV